MAGLANNKTSLGEVFRRYVECFYLFSKPDIFDLSKFSKNNENDLDVFPQYNGLLNHNIKYFHTPFNLYRAIKSQTKTVERSKDVRKIGYFVWESSELYDYDSKVFDDFDEIWTPSNYCKQIFSQYIKEDKIKIINHPLNHPIKKYKKFNKFTILIIGSLLSLDDRKNISTNLKLASTIQQKYKDIDIIFKTWSSCDNERVIINELKKLGDIKVIDSFYSPEKTEELIGKCHVVLSLHRSEGFGLTLAEAIINDTIPISTGYSGNTEFIFEKDLLVDYKLVDVHHDFFKGQWAEPDFNNAFDKLENVFNNYKKYKKNIAVSKDLLLKNNNKFIISETIKNNLYETTESDYTKLLAHPYSLEKEFKGGIFNPAFLKENNKNYLLCRTEGVVDLKRKHPFQDKTDIILLELDKNLENIKKYKIIKSVNSFPENKKLEDFRSFQFKNKTLFSATFINEKNIGTCISELNLSDSNISSAYFPKLLNFDCNKTEKNWSYFVNNDELFLLYSTQPYILFKHIGDYKFEKIIDIKDNPFLNNKGIISNSINPFVLDDYFFHIVHINIGEKTYKHYPLLIDKVSLKPKYVSDVPLFEKHNCFGTHRRVLYLTDYYLNDNDIHFFFGEGDLCVSKKTMKLDELRNINWKTYE